MPLANDSIMSGTLIRLFRHLKHQNVSTGDDFIYNCEMILLAPFLATREVMGLLTNDPIMLGTSIRFYKYLKL